MWIGLSIVLALILYAFGPGTWYQIKEVRRNRRLDRLGAAYEPDWGAEMEPDRPTAMSPKATEVIA